MSPSPGPSAQVVHGPCARSGCWYCVRHGKPTWGYRRIHGELLVLEIKVAASTVWQTLTDAGIDPADNRTSTTWPTFPRSQASALPACDFIETFTLHGTRLYLLTVIEHTSRRIRVLGATTHPTAALATQAAKNLAMDLEDTGTRTRFVIRHRDRKFPALFDAVLADAGISVALGGVRIPQMNAIMERWIQSCRRELLDRTLIWNQQHLPPTPCASTNSSTTPTSLIKASPTHNPHRALPPPITNQAQLVDLHVHRRQRQGGILNEYHHTA